MDRSKNKILFFVGAVAGVGIGHVLGMSTDVKGSVMFLVGVAVTLLFAE